MPLIDVYARRGVFDDTKELARRLAATVMAVEEVPDIPMFRETPLPSCMNLPPTPSPMSKARRTTYACRC